MRTISSITLLLLIIVTALTINSGYQQPLQGASSTEHKVLKYDRDKNCATDQHTPLNPTTYLTHFSCGNVQVLKNDTTVRNFTLVIREDIKVPLTMGNPATHTPQIMYPAWTFNGSIPAPTIRVTQGDHVNIKVENNGTMPHSFHMHSIHTGALDGTMFNNASGQILPGKSFTYSFIADPVGLWPFHCHMMPLALHITKGLYGHMIIDPPANEARPAMHEMNMIMNGFDLGLNQNTELPRLPTAQEAQQIMSSNETISENASEALPQERDNNVYALNSVAFYYDVHTIPIKLNEPYRIYLTNFLDFDFQNTFHIHGTVFQYYPSGTGKTPAMVNDIVSLAQGDRGILEFKYAFPGLFMIHSHFESQAGRGWEGLLHVTGDADPGHKTMGMGELISSSSASSSSNSSSSSGSHNGGGHSSSDGNPNTHL